MTSSPSALRHMIDSQLLPNEVTDEKLLAVMTTTPREHFVPPLFADSAYADNEIPLGHGRQMLCPLTLSLMLQRANVQLSDKILHVGVGLGYGAALLHALAAQVVGIESQHDLLETARANLQKKYTHVEIFNANLTVGYPLAAPFTLIFVEGAVQHLPSGLLDQLAEGGRLIAVQNIQQRVEGKSGLGRILVVTKEKGFIRQSLHEDVAASMLTGFERKTEFAL